MRRTFITLCGAVAALAAVAAFAAGCARDGASAELSANGGGGSRGGSMARFAITDDGEWLYTVGQNDLKVVSLADATRPVEGEHIGLGGGIETIFPMDDLLFIGSQTGMQIFDIEKREFPVYISTTTHFRSCDPVVAADTLAFVTLNSSLGTWCGGSRNVLQVYDIRDLYAPRMLTEISMSSPRGLAVDLSAKMIFVCDNGIKAYDVTDPGRVEAMFSSLPLAGVGRVDAYDCIVVEPGRLLVIGADGLYQLGYTREGFSFISKIDIRRTQ
jgi:hypothetical protein